MTDRFYVAFEDRYRGSRELIYERLKAYLPFVAPLASEFPGAEAVDLGCGRGEWLQLVQDQGLRPFGVDLDAGMLSRCEALGLAVQQGDALAYLAGLPDNSQAMVSAFHLVEHIPFDAVRRLVEESLRVLRPGGLLILETPNPENIAVGTNHFYLDPTHQKPIPHQLLVFLPEHCGFERTKVVRLQEAAALVHNPAPGLHDVLVGASPDYAVVAQKTAAAAILTSFDGAFSRNYGLSLDELATRHDASVREQTRSLVDQAGSASRAVASAADLARQSMRQASRAETDMRRMEVDLQRLEVLTHQVQALALHLEARTKSLEALQQQAEKWHGATAASMSNVVNRLTHVEQSGLTGLLKYRVARPLAAGAVAAGTALLKPFPSLRRHAGAWLSTHQPHVHQRLVRLARGTGTDHPAETVGSEEPTGEETAHPTPIEVPKGLHTRTGPIGPRAALANAALGQLARPLELDKYLSQQRSASESEALEPVTTLGQMRRSAASVCFVITVDQDDAEALGRSVQSVLRQTDPTWEILLCGSEAMQTHIAEWLDIDWRIRRVTPGADANEVQNILRASGLATSLFLGLLAQGDVVDDDLVKRISHSLTDDPELDLIYTDEAALMKDGSVTSPFFKPDWSPEHQHSVNLVGRFLAVRKALLLNLPVAHTGSREADEYALALAVTSVARGIGHIEDVLYVREREIDIPVGGFFSPEGLEPARHVLQAHLAQESPDVEVVAHPNPGSLQVKWPIPEGLEVTLLILTAMQERTVPGRGHLVLATNFVRSIIAKSTFKGYRIIVVDDGHVPDELRDLLAAHGHTTRTFTKNGEFSFAEKSNFATSLVSSGVALLLNDDLEVIAGDWIEALVSHAVRPDVGVVGGKLLFPNDTIQHAGISTGLNGSAGHVFMNSPSRELEYGGYASVDRNWGAVTGAVMAYRKDFFDQMGGFDEVFRVDYNDIDFCLRCVKAGYRVVFTPHAALYHFHNSSFKRKHDKSTERQEFLARWQRVVDRDPYCGLHLRAICAEQHNDSTPEHDASPH
ncbi:methyltransferase domain-containing protein [Hydrogenophaga sp. SL48]|uniref:methyltransferase domain-containing protein n=1 Tax=Hydrogenophaga sp. SL48 TaxID=2806347 RepID=UPI001F39B3C8|nr:glycosyltransferase [Hydrogenophaga sp. SL48]UJW81810.1 glycosyltransferase [Hydrogenophaga sp. SL48]